MLIGSIFLFLGAILLFLGLFLPALIMTQQTAATATPSPTPSPTPSQDITPPTLTVPNGIVSDISVPGGMGIISFNISAQDNIDGSAALADDNTLYQDNVGGSIAIGCSPASGSNLPIGDHTLRCSATDSAGNTATASFLAAVRGPILLDTPELPDEPGELSTGTPPTITVPDDIVVEAGSDQGAQLTYRVTAQDNVDGTATLDENNILSQDNVGGDITISCSYPSGTSLPIRNDTVYCGATDAAGNRAEAHFTAVVRGPTLLDTPELPEPRELNTQDQNAIDQQAQTLQAEDTTSTSTLAADTTAPGGSSGSGGGGDGNITAFVIANPATYNGRCSTELTNFFGIEFIGTITDNVGNRDVHYRFIFHDGVAYEQVIRFDQPGSQNVFSRTATTRSTEGWVAIEILQPVQLQSNKAEYKITCAEDTAGLLDTPELPDEPRELNTGPGLPDTPALPGGAAPAGGERDTIVPTLDLPDDMVLQTANNNGVPTALLVYSVTAEDNVDGNATLDEDNQIIQADNVGGSIAISCTPSSQYFLSVGNHLVQCRANDANGNPATASFIVSVVNPAAASPAGSTDTMAPSLTIRDVRQRPGDEVLYYEVRAQDNVDGNAYVNDERGLDQDNVGGNITIACNPASEITLSPGNHTVHCSAADAAGNPARASLTVSVRSGPPPPGTDTTPPDLTVPDDQVYEIREPGDARGTSQFFRVTAQDNVDGTAILDENGILSQDNIGGDIAIYCDPVSVSLLTAGSHRVRCHAVDAAGYQRTSWFIVAVLPPGGTTVTASANPVTYDGPCPSPIQYEGTITDNLGFREVRYRFIFSTGATTEEQVIDFGMPGSQRVSYTSPGVIPPGLQGWVAIEILQPVQLQSNQAQFQITCTPSTGGAPTGAPSGTSGVGGITASANPTTYNGPCPANIQINGTITDNVGNRDVTYRFIFATGGTTEEQVIRFNQPGSQTVSYTASGFEGRPIQGWVAIEILQPVQLQSNQAQFQITCTPAAGAPAGGPDTTKPTLTQSGGGEINYDVDNTALVDYQVTAQDNVDGSATLDVNNMLSQDTVGGSITISCSPASPSKLPIGDHTVECTATDAAGNPGTLSFTISIPRPTTPVGPTLQAAEDEDTTAGAADGEGEEDTTAPPATTDDDDAGAAGGGGGADGTDDDTTTGGGGGAGDTSNDDDDSSAGGTDGTDDNEPQ